ncbi:hypothetical protein JL721_5920 [Aureococcus anophagefferens]|nr:hypothetical protein JL721_5920 [Aureococcus anophagefferens]
MAYRFLRTLHGLAPVAGLGAAAVGGATALSEPWKSVKPPVQRRLTAVSDATIEAQLFVPAVPYPQWDYNWDHRDFDSHGKRRKPGMAGAAAARRRHIILVRHGQYQERKLDDEARILTPLGRAQADACGASASSCSRRAPSARAPAGRLRLCTMNCSITYLTISPSGHVAARLMGDVGHLKPDQITFGEHKGFNW